MIFIPSMVLYLAWLQGAQVQVIIAELKCIIAKFWFRILYLCWYTAKVSFNHNANEYVLFDKNLFLW